MLKTTSSLLNFRVSAVGGAGYYVLCVCVCVKKIPYHVMYLDSQWIYIQRINTFNSCGLFNLLILKS